MPYHIVRPTPMSADTYHLLTILHWSNGGLDIRALIRRADLPPGRLIAAIREAEEIGRVRVRPRRPRPGLPEELAGIARVSFTRLGRRWGLA